MKREANISTCGNFRFSLSRTWDEEKPKVMFIMLNPSTADAEKDDPTIRRCIGFAQSWGYGGLIVCNLFAWRATSPKGLEEKEFKRIGTNYHTILTEAAKVDTVVCAWGNKPVLDKMLYGAPSAYIPFEVTPKLHYLELSVTGTPKHPLYLKKDLKPIKWDNFKTK